MKCASLLLAFATTLLSGFLLSCATLPVDLRGEDATNREELWGGFAMHTNYVLQEDAFIMNKAGWASKTVLLPPQDAPGKRRFHWNAPASMEVYENKKELWLDVRGIVQAGTVLKTTKLGVTSVAFCPYLYVRATIQDGEHAGKEVDITDMSARAGAIEGLSLLSPEPLLLTPAGR